MMEIDKIARICSADVSASNKNNATGQNFKFCVEDSTLAECVGQELICREQIFTEKTFRLTNGDISFDQRSGTDDAKLSLLLLQHFKILKSNCGRANPPDLHNAAVWAAAVEGYATAQTKKEFVHGNGYVWTEWNGYCMTDEHGHLAAENGYALWLEYIRWSRDKDYVPQYRPGYVLENVPGKKDRFDFVVGCTDSTYVVTEKGVHNTMLSAVDALNGVISGQNVVELNIIAEFGDCQKRSSSSCETLTKMEKQLEKALLVLYADKTLHVKPHKNKTPARFFDQTRGPQLMARDSGKGRRPAARAANNISDSESDEDVGDIVTDGMSIVMDRHLAREEHTAHKQFRDSKKGRRSVAGAADESSDEDVGDIETDGMAMPRDLHVTTSGAHAAFKPAVYRDCPVLPTELKITNYSFLIDQNIPFISVVQEMTKCLAKISDYKFVYTPSEKSWLGKMEIPGVVISHVKLNIYCSHEPIARTAPIHYTIEARRILGDIPAFYSFVRELHVKLNNKPAENTFEAEETEDLNEELIAQCANGDASVVRRMLSLPQVDPTRYNKNGTTALHMICHHGHQHLYALLMEVKDDKMDLYLRSSNTGRTPMETALDNKQMDFIEFVHETHNVPLPEGFYASRPAVTEMETVPTYETAASRALAASGLANPNLVPVPITPARTMEEKHARFRLLSGKEPPTAALDRKNFAFNDPSDRTPLQQPPPTSFQPPAQLRSPPPPQPTSAHKRAAGNDNTSEPVDQPNAKKSASSNSNNNSSSSNSSSSIRGRFQESSSEMQIDDEEAEFMRVIAEHGPPPQRSPPRSQPMGGSNLPEPPPLTLSSTEPAQTTDGPDTTSVAPNTQPDFIKGDNVQPHSQSVTPDLTVSGSPIETVTKSDKETLVKQRGYSSEDDVLNAMLLPPNNPTAGGALSTSPDAMSVQDESSADTDQPEESQHMLQSVETAVLMKTDTITSSPAGSLLQRDLRRSDSGSESDLECDVDKSSDSEGALKSKRVVESPTTVTHCGEAESYSIKIQTGSQNRCDFQSLVAQMLETIEQYAAYYASIAPKTKLNRQITQNCKNTILRIVAEEMKLPPRSRSQTALNACTSLDRVSLIHLAAGMNDTELLSALLDNNADVNVRDGNNQTPLHIAARYNNCDIVKLLLSRKDICIDALDSHPDSPMSPLHISAQAGHIEIMNMLTERDASHRAHRKLRTPMHWAAHAGKLNMCSELIKIGCDVDTIDELGDTPMIVTAKAAQFTDLTAAASGKSDGICALLAKQQQYFDVLELFLLHNARVDIFNHGDKGEAAPRQRTVLHYINDDYIKRRVAETLVQKLFAAVRDNDVKMVTLMVNMGVSVDYTLNKFLDTPLHLACRQSDNKVVIRLLEAGASANAQNYWGMTPLICAAQRGSVSIVKLLLQTAPNVMLTDCHGRTAMHYAASAGNVDILRVLLLPSTTPVAAANVHNLETELISSTSKTESIEMVIEKAPDADEDAKLSSVTVGLKNMNMSDAERNSCELSDENKKVIIVPEPDYIGDYTANIVNINATTHLGSNLLSFALVNDKLECIDFLFSCGGRVRQCDIMGRTVESFILLKDPTPPVPPAVAPTPAANTTSKTTATVALAALGFEPFSRPSSTDGSTAMEVASDSNNSDSNSNIVNTVNSTSPVTAEPSATAQPTSVVEETAMVVSEETAPAVEPAETVEKVPDPAVVKIFKRDAHAQLYHAAIKNCVDRIKYIIDSLRGKININQRVEDRQQTDFLNGKMAWNVVYETALYGAVIRGHTAVVRYLLDEGANATIPSRNGWAPIFAASKKNFSEIVTMLVRAPNVDVNFKNKNEMTSLNIAAYMGYIEVCRILLASGADPNIGDKLGARPLHAAVQNISRPIVDMLLKHNADVNVVTTSGISPLYVAAFNGHADVVEKFIKLKADVNCANFEGLTPLHVSSFNGHKDCCEQLLIAKANVNHEEKNKVSALYAACQNGHLDIVKLLKKFGAEINHRIVSENRPIHTATIDGKVDIVKQLIEWNADIDAGNLDKATAFYMAAEKGHLEILNLLYNTGKVDINAVNSHGVTPLNIASQNGHFSIVERLLELDAEVDIQSITGPSALFIASQNGHTEIVRALLKKKANLDFATKDGETAVFVSAYFGYLEITQMLIDAGAKLNTPDNDGRTPLWWAAKNGKVEIVEALLKARADANISDREDKTPAQIAAYMKHDKVCELLAAANSPPQLCSICLANPRNVVFLPCRHMLCCVDCNRKLVKSNLSGSCPLCRDQIEERVTVYNL